MSSLKLKIPAPRARRYCLFSSSTGLGEEGYVVGRVIFSGVRLLEEVLTFVSEEGSEGTELHPAIRKRNKTEKIDRLSIQKEKERKI